MQQVIETARAKINLALHVLGRRMDGYHELDSIVAFVDAGDVLRIAPAERNTLAVDGPFAPEVPGGDGNIIWKAWRHLNDIFPTPFVSVQLQKNLPVASGMGGGSADAAAMLRGLLRITERSLDDSQVARLAAIGADVPVCFVGRAARMEGIGEKISVLTEMLPPALVLVNPLVSCSTAEVFKAMGLQLGETRLSNRGDLRNDMTEAAVKVQPVVANVLSALEKTKLWPVRMSGSGATCFGIASSVSEAEMVAAAVAELHPEWWVKAARILS